MYNLTLIDEKDAFIWLKLFMEKCDNLKELVKTSKYPDANRDTVTPFLLVSRLIYACGRNENLKDYIAKRSLVPEKLYTEDVIINSFKCKVSKFQKKLIESSFENVTTEYLKRELHDATQAVRHAPPPFDGQPSSLRRQRR